MMNDGNVIQKGSQVKLHLRISLADGFVVEDTTSGPPLEFVVGDGELDAALESRLLGLRAGSQEVVRIAAGEAFGVPDAENIQQLPREQFADFSGEQIRKGSILGFETPSGEQVPGMIIKVGDTDVTVYFNQPLAGKAFQMEVNVLAVEPAQPKH